MHSLDGGRLIVHITCLSGFHSLFVQDKHLRKKYMEQTW